LNPRPFKLFNILLSQA